jgi:tetratricopeptide (TPR) repeat protein
MVDPGTAIAIGQVVLTGVREAWSRLRNRSEVKNFFRVLPDLIAEDRHLPWNERKHIADAASFLGSNPDFIGALDDYLSDGDAPAVERMRPRLEETVKRFVDSDATEIAPLVDALIEDVHRAVNRAKLSEREAGYLQHERTRSAFAESQQNLGVVRLLNVDDAPEWTQKALKALGEKAPRELEELMGRTRDGKDPDGVRRLITGEDVWAEHASELCWVALGRMAESIPDWTLAIDAWRKTCARSAHPAKALIRASICAHMAGDDALREELLAQATAADPSNPQLVLESIESVDDSAERLAALENLHFDDPPLMALLWCHRGLAHLLAGDTDAAVDAVEQALAADPTGMQARGMDLNVRLQRYRDSILRNDGANAVDLQDIEGKALALRDEYLAMARVTEACRMLMIASDCLVLAGRRDEVPELLATATEGEIERERGDVVLAEAALRAVSADAALRLLREDELDEERRRIRAQAMSQQDDAVAYSTGISELDALIDENGEEAERASLVRLVRCLGNTDLAWNDRAEQLVAGSEHDWLVTHAKALWLASNDALEDAVALLTPRLPDPVAHETLLLVYVRTGENDAAAEVAKDILERGTRDPILRFECAMAFRRVADLGRMRSELHTVAGDERAQHELRVMSYATLADHARRPEERFDMLQKWQELAPQDPELVSAWAAFGDRLR